MRSYYHLAKPGIIYGNTITAIAGFLFASRGDIDWLLLSSMAFGLALTIASACVFNNYIDRDIDALMERTKNRELPSARITPQSALIFGSVLGLLGFSILFFFTNLLTLSILVFGFFVYVFGYGFAKRRTVYFTYIGAIAGALPPVAGYTAVTHSFDTGAFLLYAILFFWQMAHFYSITIYREDEYAAANIPVMPTQKGLYRTKLEIVFFTIAFSFTIFTLASRGLGGNLYLGITSVFCTLWLALAFKGFWATDHKRWARQMFLFSLVVIVLFSLAISINAFW